MFNSVFGKKPSQQGESLGWEPRSPLAQNKTKERPATYAKIFRWVLPEGQTVIPNTVEIVGSFTGWQKVALQRNGALNDWQLTLPSVPGHQTHHYMLLAEAQPSQDKNCGTM